MAKIIFCDSFDRESISDILVEENISTIEIAEKIARDKNNKLHENSFMYYKAVEDDYVLWDASKLY